MGPIAGSSTSSRGRPKISRAASRASVVAYGSTPTATTRSTPRRYGNGDEKHWGEPAALRGDRGRARSHPAARGPSRAGASGRRRRVVPYVPRQPARLSVPADGQQPPDV